MTPHAFEIGPLQTTETDALGRIFFDAVHEGAAAFYSVEQRRAWAPIVPSGAKWASRLLSQQTLVARDNGQPLGFITLDGAGYIDLAFVAPAHQRRGIGESLLGAAEQTARDAGIAKLHTEASLVLKGLLQRHGWTILRAQDVERSQVKLANYVMEKDLRSA